MNESLDSSYSATIADCPDPVRQATILAIDDDPDILQTIKLRFRQYNVEVLQAFHGMHGFALAAEKKPDVIITDLRMPQGEGDYVVECLKRNSQTSHIPIIVLTGQRDNYLRRRLRNLGIDEYLTKPIAFDDLREAVGRFIDLQEKANDD